MNTRLSPIITNMILFYYSPSNHLIVEIDGPITLDHSDTEVKTTQVLNLSREEGLLVMPWLYF